MMEGWGKVTKIMLSSSQTWDTQFPLSTLLEACTVRTYSSIVRAWVDSTDVRLTTTGHS